MVTPRATLIRTIVAGTIGGWAMIPPGLILLLALERPIDVYGELLARTLFGSARPWSLALVHLATSWGMAAPLVGLVATRSHRAGLLGGVAYGAAIWLGANSLLLPALFGRPTPWQLGWSAIWPSLAVHLVYGVATGLAVVWLFPAPVRPGSFTIVSPAGRGSAGPAPAPSAQRHNDTTSTR